MNLRRVLMAVALVCGLCVWGFARSNVEPASAQGANAVPSETEEDENGNHDEAAARYRTNQARHWRQLAIGTATNH